MMNTREHIRLMLDRIPESTDLAKVRETDLQRHSQNIEYWLDRLSTDWRNFRDRNLAAIIEDRSARNQPIEEAKRGVSLDATKVDEEGQVIPGRLDEAALSPLTPEQEIISM